MRKVLKPINPMGTFSTNVCRGEMGLTCVSPLQTLERVLREKKMRFLSRKTPANMKKTSFARYSNSPRLNCFSGVFLSAKLLKIKDLAFLERINC